MLDSARQRIVVLASLGFYAKTVQRIVKKYDGEEYSLSTIYKTSNQEGVSFRDYRQGKGDEAEAVIRRTTKSLQQHAKQQVLRNRKKPRSKKKARKH